MTKTPIQSLTAPPHLNYRVERAAMNSAKLSPPVGKRFTLEESTALREWVITAGFQAWFKGQSVYVVGDDAPDITDGLFEQRAAKANAKAMDKQESVEAVASSRAGEYRELPSSQWIEVEMGTDFANPFNKLMLARFLDGKDEFKGLMGSGWVDPLTSLGLDTQSEGFMNSDVLAFLNGSYDKFKAAQLQEQQLQHKESRPAMRM